MLRKATSGPTSRRRASRPRLQRLQQKSQILRRSRLCQMRRPLQKRPRADGEPGRAVWGPLSTPACADVIPAFLHLRVLHHHHHHLRPRPAEPAADMTQICESRRRRGQGYHPFRTGPPRKRPPALSPFTLLMEGQPVSRRLWKSASACSTRCSRQEAWRSTPRCMWGWRESDSYAWEENCSTPRRGRTAGAGKGQQEATRAMRIYGLRRH